MYERVQAVLKEREVEAMIVSAESNIRYLSGYRGDTGYLYISGKQRVLMTDSRYTTQAAAEAPEFKIMEIGAERNYGQLIHDLLKEDNATSLGFEDTSLIYADMIKLKEKCGDIRWEPLGEHLNKLRIVKTPEELKRLEKAEHIGDKAFDYILGEIKPGITELQLAAKLEYRMKELGAEDKSFNTIVASGLNSAMPHAIPSNRKIEKGDFVTMDFGCRHEGYCSDMTRTVVVGKADDKQKEIYNTVLQAQLAALEVLKAGMKGSEVDKVARDIITEAGYGAYFGHGLGHSVGLDIHEEPRLSPTCHEVLLENVIATVEPGIYVPDFGGVRIEDMVVVTKKGYQNFTHSPKELIEL